jgi:hypothetical protein
MISLGIPERLVSIYMEPGKLDLLCYIPPLEIISKGIPYLRATLEFNDQYTLLFDRFYAYMIKICTHRYNPELWNVYQFRNQWENIQNRTNNALERFNRIMNERLPKHPNISKLVETIKKISAETVIKLDDIANKRITLVMYRPMLFLQLPDAYLDFETQNEEQNYSFSDEDEDDDSIC